MQGDTDIVPAEGLTGGSRFLALGGVAALSAADDVIEKGKQEAARRLEAAATDIEYSDGEFRIAGTDRKVALFDLGKLEARKRVRRRITPIQTAVTSAKWSRRVHRHAS